MVVVLVVVMEGLIVANSCVFLNLSIDPDAILDLNVDETSIPSQSHP